MKIVRAAESGNRVHKAALTPSHKTAKNQTLVRAREGLAEICQ